MTKKPEAGRDWLRLQPGRCPSASGAIVEQVRSALFRGDLKTGDVLGSETDLARQLGVSRVPVRDAFRTLQALGIVDIKMGANGGAHVAAGNPSRFADALAVQFKLVGIEAEELFEAEIAVEGAAAALAAANATERDLAAMRDLLAALAAKTEDREAFTAGGLQFHLQVVEASHNRALIAYAQALIAVLYDTYAPQTDPARARRVLARHQEIYDCIAARDGARASDAITAHLRHVRSHVLRGIRNRAQAGPAGLRANVA